MRQDDEKELVLGNKQLLSLFFVAAALCGVCFALGYMMGRNATKAQPAADSATTAAVDGRRTQPDGAPPPADPPFTPPPVTETKPAQETPPAPVAETKPAPPEPKPYQAKKGEPDPLTISTAEPGASYLQVAALPRPDAENMVNTLREQHFTVIMAISPKPGFFRVLVGPYHQTVQLSDAKTRLKALGFNGAFVQKQ